MSRCRWVGAAMVTASTPAASRSVDVENVRQPSVRHPLALLRVRIDDTDELHARQIGKHAGMVAAHDADADDADAQNPIRTTFRGVHHG